MHRGDFVTSLAGVAAQFPLANSSVEGLTYEVGKGLPQNSRGRVQSAEFVLRVLYTMELRATYIAFSGYRPGSELLSVNRSAGSLAFRLHPGTANQPLPNEGIRWH